MGIGSQRKVPLPMPTMKSLGIVAATALVTVVLMAAALVYLAIPAWRPLVHLFQSTSIGRVEIENRTLTDVVQDIVKQVESKSGKKIRILFSPEKIASRIRERDGGVYGNPPVEGVADHALCIVAFDYRCSVAYVDDDTVLMYLADGDMSSLK